MVLKVSLNTGINRIRLEFKDVRFSFQLVDILVLIESDWNLKVTAAKSAGVISLVLIESDWNLKPYTEYPVTA